jgi:hypothetical protein
MLISPVVEAAAAEVSLKQLYMNAYTILMVYYESLSTMISRLFENEPCLIYVPVQQ